MHVLEAGADRETLPWWAWRRRAARTRFLEMMARSEVRISLNGEPQLACSFENAYLTVKYAGGSEEVAGIRFAKIAHIVNPDTNECLDVSLRLPLAVKL